MKNENLTEVQIAWILYHLHERMTDLIWDHYEKEFLDCSRKELDRIMDEELDRLLESESQENTHSEEAGPPSTLPPT